MNIKEGLGQRWVKKRNQFTRDTRRGRDIRRILLKIVVVEVGRAIGKIAMATNTMNK